jgi:hypothetical protein
LILVVGSLLSLVFLPWYFLKDLSAAITFQLGRGRSAKGERRAVLITGCDSGFGRDLAMGLVQQEEVRGVIVLCRRKKGYFLFVRVYGVFEGGGGGIGKGGLVHHGVRLGLWTSPWASCSRRR